VTAQTFTFTDGTGTEIFVYEWLPEHQPVKAVVQISHGMAETAARYERFATALNQAGYAVVANDHRGHGQSAKQEEDLGYLGEDGYHWMIRNLLQLNDITRVRHANLPIFLLGHSMGAALAQHYLALHASSIQGVVLSGPIARPGPLLYLGISLAKREMNRRGSRARSQTLANLTLGAYNKPFAPARTPFDWLTRDVNEVDLYVDNPYCGGVLTTNFYYNFYKGLAEVQSHSLMQEVPKHMPIYILAGNQDPVGHKGKGVMQLVNQFQKLHLQEVTHKLYSGARHEILNETNRDEVTQDILHWLEQQTN
jgi:alpha-beta hydrolase superfamily lysophospholipase